MRLVLDDGDDYPLDRQAAVLRRQVDADTGQITLRAELPNPKRELLPGMYVRVRIEQGIETDAIVVPQQAVQRDAAATARCSSSRRQPRRAAAGPASARCRTASWFVDRRPEGRRQGRGRRLPEIAPATRSQPQSWAEAEAARATARLESAR